MARNDNAGNGKKIQDTLKNFGEYGADIPYSIIVNESGNAVEVQPSYPKPNRKQTLKRYYFRGATGAASQRQIATPTATTRLYYVGATMTGDSSVVATTLNIYDATSGAEPSDTATNTLHGVTSTASFKDQNFLPLPALLTSGLRFSWDGNTTGAIRVTFYYIEETTEN